MRGKIKGAGVSDGYMLEEEEEGEDCLVGLGGGGGAGYESIFSSPLASSPLLCGCSAFHFLSVVLQLIILHFDPPLDASLPYTHIHKISHRSPYKENEPPTRVHHRRRCAQCTIHSSQHNCLHGAPALKDNPAITTPTVELVMKVCL